MPLLHLDVETFGTVPFGSGREAVNAATYFAHPDTELMLHQWAVDDGPVQVREGRTFCDELLEMLTDPSYLVVAFNAPFERKAISRFAGLNLPAPRFYCTMVGAYYFSFTGGLDAVCRQMGMGDEEAKLADGRRLVLKFAKPRKPSAKDPSTRWGEHNAPEDWATFRDEYAPQDVVASRAIYHRVQRWGGVPKSERETWFMDQDINATGWPVDTAMVDRACMFYGRLKSELFDRLLALTCLDNPNSDPQFKAWLAARGVQLPDLQKQTLADLVANTPLSPELREVVETRIAYGRRTPDKYLALQRSTIDGRIHDTLQMAAASRTQRWGGRTFQPQNLYSARAWDEDQLNQLCEDIA